MCALLRDIYTGDNDETDPYDEGDPSDYLAWVEEQDRLANLPEDGEEAA